MIIEFNDELNYLRKIRSGEIKTGSRLGFPAIDEYIRFKPANFNIVLGHANVGKTSMALYIMLLYSILHSKKWLVYSSENPAHSLIRKLREYMEGLPLEKVSDNGMNRTSLFINTHFKFINAVEMYTYKELLSLGKVIKDGWEYDGFFIDPYNSLKKDFELLKNVGGHEYDYHACTEIRIFCKEYNVSTWLNTHANTSALRTLHRFEDEFAGYPVPPLASDIEGGGKFVNRADDFWVIHRYIQHPSEYINTHLHVRKVKEIETGGRPTMLNAPIKFKALPNNVGYTLEEENLLELVKTPKNLPF
jgi:hypothetical protein